MRNAATYTEVPTVKHPGKQTSGCPWQQDEAETSRLRCVGRTPCLGKVSHAALLAHQQHSGGIVTVARTPTLGKEELKSSFM